jgi:hypothetical protein
VPAGISWLLHSCWSRRPPCSHTRRRVWKLLFPERDTIQ